MATIVKCDICGNVIDEPFAPVGRLIFKSAKYDLCEHCALIIEKCANYQKSIYNQPYMRKGD